MVVGYFVGALALANFSATSRASEAFAGPSRVTRVPSPFVWETGLMAPASAFLIRFGDGIDGAGEGDTDHEVIIDAMSVDGMGTAASDLSDKRGTLEGLQVVAEFLRA